MTTANLFSNNTTAPSQMVINLGGAGHPEGHALFQQVSNSLQPEVVVKRQFEQRNQDQKTQLANDFIESAGRDGINDLATTPDGQHALAVVYEHADGDRIALMRQMYEGQGTTAVDYTNQSAETGKAMGSGAGLLQSSATASSHTQQVIELINKRSAEMGVSINLDDRASEADINQASEMINAVIKYDQKTFGTVLTTDKMRLLNEYIQLQERDLSPIAFADSENKYAPIKPIIEKIVQLKSESGNENGFFGRLNQNINKSAAFRPLFQSQSTGQPVVDGLTAISDAILNLPTNATNLLLVAANSPAIVLSSTTGDSLEKTEIDLIGAAMSVSPLLEGAAELSTIRRVIGLKAVDTTRRTSSRLAEGGNKVSDFLQKSFRGRLTRGGEATVQVELKIQSESSSVSGGESVGIRNTASPDAGNGVRISNGASGLHRSLTPRIDLTDHFNLITSRSGSRTYRYMDPEDGIHGLEVHVDKNGVLGFNIRAQSDASVYGSGRDMFISMMQRLGKDGVAVNKIRGYWMSGPDSVNYLQFIQNTSKIGEVKAAQQTWTGKIASDYGFTKVESIKESFGNITVIFGK